jgi:hypothetical protein
MFRVLALHGRVVLIKCHADLRLRHSESKHRQFNQRVLDSFKRAPRLKRVRKVGERAEQSLCFKRLGRVTQIAKSEIVVAKFQEK